MKRKLKLFALLLAMVVFMAFHANTLRAASPTSWWILADTSGFAKNVLKSDSFPRVKKGLYNWLSVGTDGKPYVHHRNDTSDYREIYEDARNRFKVTLVTDVDSARFHITSECGDKLSMNWKNDLVSQFAIVQFDSTELNATTGDSTNAWFRKAQKMKTKHGGDTIEGYLAHNQGEIEDGLRSASPSLILAGSDRNGNISFRQFSDFGVFMDSMALFPFMSAQVGEDSIIPTPGRLYVAGHNPPYFQAHGKNALGNDTMLVPINNHPGIFNWATIKEGKNTGAPKYVYAYYDFRLTPDGVVGFEGSGIDSAKKATVVNPVTLDTILRYVKNRGLWALDTISHARLFDVDTIQKWARDSSLLFFQSVDGELRVTGLSQAAENIGKDKPIENYFTNGAPSSFLITPSGSNVVDSVEDAKKQKVYFYLSVDTCNKNKANENAFTCVDSVLRVIFGLSVTDRYMRHVPGFIYNRLNRDETNDWRPLYVQAVASKEQKLYKYVDSKWLKNKKYDIAAVAQTATDALGKPKGSVIVDGNYKAVIGAVGDANATKFLFEFADSIGGATRKLSRYTNVDSMFKNSEKIELFHIRSGDRYLTVMDTTEFGGVPTPDSTVTNTQLGWFPKMGATTESGKKATTMDTLRQVFAIVYDYKLNNGCGRENEPHDSILTFLPVASYEWKATYDVVAGTNVASYGHPRYNLSIGAWDSVRSPRADTLVSLKDVWYVTQYAKTGYNEVQKLIIADPKSAQTSNEPIWFQTRLAYKAWEPPCGDGNPIAVYKYNKTHHYSAQKLIPNGDVDASTLRSHWYADKVDTTHKPLHPDLREWKFVPEFDAIYGEKQNKRLPSKYLAIEWENGDVELIDTTFSDDRKNLLATNIYTRDTIQVGCIEGNYKPFLDISNYVGAGTRVAILESLYEDRNISYYKTDLDKEEWQVVDGSDGTKLEAYIRKVDRDKRNSFAWLNVYRSNVQHLGRRVKADGTSYYKVPYFLFSYDKDGEEYFLKANTGELDPKRGKGTLRWEKVNDSIKNVLKSSKNSTNWNSVLAQYKFCLPLKITDNDQKNKVYLQTLDSAQRSAFALVKAGTETGITEAGTFDEALIYKDTAQTADSLIYDWKEGIYGALGQYGNIQQVSSWIIYNEDGLAEWVEVKAAVDGADKEDTGVLTNVNNISPGAAYLAPQSEKDNLNSINFGILTDRENDGRSNGRFNNLTLKYIGRENIGYDQEPIWYYNIKHDKGYLTDAYEKQGDPSYVYDYTHGGSTDPVQYIYAYFDETLTAPDKKHEDNDVLADAAFSQALGLQYVNRSVNDDFMVVSKADYSDSYEPEKETYRYLGRVGDRLVFVNRKDDALKFRWGKLDEDGKYTGIKAAGAGAKIYGVAGGVKIADASGNAVAIYTVDGRLITKQTLASPNQTIAVPAGIYIVKSGAEITKVVVK
jgi:hypothetical protein